MTEQELAKYVIKWLTDNKWEVYQEVQPTFCRSVCDIVAVKNEIVWAIECKKSFGIAVLEQAYKWTNKCNQISIATLYKHIAIKSFSYQMMKQFGFGHITVFHNGLISEYIEPRLHFDGIYPELKNSLREEHKTWAKAGNSDGKRYTPYTATIQLIKDDIQEHGKSELKDVVNRITHHYASDKSARSSLSTWIGNGDVKGLKLIRENRKVYVDNE